jgi:hypothetical protein
MHIKVSISILKHAYFKSSSHSYTFFFNCDFCLNFAICVLLDKNFSTFECEGLYPASKVLSYIFLARRSERDSAELVYILCGADNPKAWIIMRNFRFDTGFITGFDARVYFKILSTDKFEPASL